MDLDNDKNHLSCEGEDFKTNKKNKWGLLVPSLGNFWAPCLFRWIRIIASHQISQWFDNYTSSTSRHLESNGFYSVDIFELTSALSIILIQGNNKLFDSCFFSSSFHPKFFNTNSIHCVLCFSFTTKRIKSVVFGCKSRPRFRSSLIPSLFSAIKWGESKPLTRDI